MEQKCISLENIDLYFVKTDKFKTIDIEIFFCGEVSKEEITWRNCLLDILLHSTKKYPSKKALTLKTAELYSLFLATSNMRFGNDIVSKISLSILNPKYTEESMLKESLDILKEIIFNPLVNDNHFNKEYLDLIKIEHEADTLSIKENPRAYSQIALLNNMENNMPFALTGYSDIDVLKKIDEYNLYEYYQKFLNNNKVFAVIVGDYDEEKIVNYFKNNLPFTSKNLEKSIIVKHEDVRTEPYVVVEDSEYQQSKLAVAFKIKDLTDFEYRYVLNIYNSILGSSADNKLMHLIREENSLAYYVNSSFSKADQLMFVSSGIDAKNFQQVIDLMKVAINDIIKGDISEHELLKGKMEYITNFDEALETPGGYIDILLGQILFDAKSVEERKQQIMKVTKEDVMNIAKKIHLDTIFLLRGL